MQTRLLFFAIIISIDSIEAHYTLSSRISTKNNAHLLNPNILPIILFFKPFKAPGRIGDDIIGADFTPGASW